MSPSEAGIQDSRATLAAPDGELRDTESPLGSTPRTIRTFLAVAVHNTGAVTKESHIRQVPEERAHAVEDKQRSQLT